MKTIQLASGTFHRLPADLRGALNTRPKASSARNSITPLARNEWICWLTSAKLDQTRSRRLERTYTELAEGKRRPCCRAGCYHREKNGK